MLNWQRRRCILPFEETSSRLSYKFLFFLSAWDTRCLRDDNNQNGRKEASRLGKTTVNLWSGPTLSTHVFADERQLRQVSTGAQGDDHAPPSSCPCSHPPCQRSAVQHHWDGPKVRTDSRIGARCRPVKNIIRRRWYVSRSSWLIFISCICILCLLSHGLVVAAHVLDIACRVPHLSV